MSMPSRRKFQPPSYRIRRGRPLVTLRDAVTKRARDYWLPGEPNSAESRQAYYQVIAEWESRGRRLPPPLTRCGHLDREGPLIIEIIAEYMRWARAGNQRWLSGFKSAFSILRKHYGHLPATEFGPKKLRLVREAMIRQVAGNGGGKTWCRRYINVQTKRIRHLFKWAASHEMVPVTVYQALCTVEPLRRGSPQVRESQRVHPVPEALLDAVRPLLSRPVRAMVELQLLTGARPGELCCLRPCDVERTEGHSVWLYRPSEDKNAWRERNERVIYIGPRAQAWLRPFLMDRAPNMFAFAPLEAEADRRAAVRKVRKTPLSCGNTPGSNRRMFPKRQPGCRYTTASYRRAIEYACRRAFSLPADLQRRRGETSVTWRKRLGDRWTEVLAWRRQHSFHPHQLRHNAATWLRREFGLEAAQLALGHSSARITDAVYAERDAAKVIEIMRRIG